MRQYIYLFLFCICSSYSLISQPTNTLVENVVMPAPNVGALGKYGDIPVSLYSGTPNISIPIYTVTDGSLNLPISLDYHASGIRVAETASWVGIGWSLQAGGVITRTTQGTDDDKSPGGFYHHGAFDLTNPNDPGKVEIYNDGRYDPEPDIYSFNVTGYSGKFTFDAGKEVHFLPKQDLKIETNLDGDESGTGTFNQFTLITPDGTRYYFGTDPQEPKRKALEYTYSGGEAFGKATASSWYLVRIESHDKKHNIKLVYESEQYGYKNLAGRRYVKAKYQSNRCGSGFKDGIEESNMSGFDAYHQYVQTSVAGKRISQIISNTATINFIVDKDPKANREDLGLYANTSNTSKKLEAIEIKSGPFCQKFTLKHDYFHDNLAKLKDHPFAKRLKLQSVQQSDCANPAKITNPPYKFEYEEKVINNVSYLPNRLNKGIDHWGFYNGADALGILNNKGGPNNENLVVNIPKTIIKKGTTVYQYGSANRDTDFEYAKIGSLKKITYPTGGHTAFTFESNKYFGEVSTNTNYDRLVLDNDKCVNNNGDFDPVNCCGAYNLQGEYTFTSVKQIKDMHFYLQLEKGCNPSIYSIHVDAFKKSNNAHVGHFEFNNSDYAETFPLSRLLRTGGKFEVDTYVFKVKIVNGVGNFTLKEKQTKLGPLDAGGLRIREIRTHDGVDLANDMVRTYEYINENGEESGRLAFQPFYAVIDDHIAVCKYEATSLRFYETATIDGVVFFDQSYVPLSSFDGRHITYSHVKESLNGNGYKTYKYLSSRDYENFYHPTYPATPVQLNPYHGQISSLKQYNEKDKVIAETKTAAHGNPLIYTIPKTIYKFTSGITFDRRTPPGQPHQGTLIRMYLSTPYQINTSVYRVAQVEEIVDLVSTITSYEYDYNYTDGNLKNDHYFPTKITTTNSDGKKYVTEHEYPFNFQDAVHKEMVERNMIGTPIRTYNKVDDVKVGGTYKICDFFKADGQPGGSGDDPIYPKQFYNYEMTWDASGKEKITGWDLQGTIESYDMTVGKPKIFQQNGWEKEIYTWDTKNKMITQREFKDHKWNYNYYPNTNLLSEIIDIDRQDTDFFYDQLMRLERVEARDKNVTTYYDYHFLTGNTDNNYIKTRIEYEKVQESDLLLKESYQYLDGIGRPLQTVLVQHASNKNKNDVVTQAVSYDNQGRVVKAYEPFQSPNIDGSFVDPLNQPASVTTYYDSPLNRTKSVTLPGWNNYPSIYKYGANSVNDNVAYFGNAENKTYGANLLNKNIVIDPNGNQSITFVDKRGRNILSRKTNATDTNKDRHDTYTLYDDKDRSKNIIPPSTNLSAVNQIYAYFYDGANNIIEKKIPDSEKIEFLYNNRDLQVAMQDGNLRMDKKWNATKYDEYGRPKTIGILSEKPNPNSISFNNNEIWTENYYDGNTSGNGLGTIKDIEIGKIKESKIATLQGNTPLNMQSTIYEYDEYGRIFILHSEHHLQSSFGGLNKHLRTINQYDNADNLISNTLLFRQKVPGAFLSIENSATFDHQGRVKSNFHTIGGKSANKKEISQLSYTAKDQIMQKQLGALPNGSFLQSIDYDYLPNGFLTHINKNKNTNDLFSLELVYDLPTMGGINGQYNGNISQVYWQTKGSPEKSYGFAYDHLDRLTSANFEEYNNSRNNVQKQGHYNTTYSYDKRGNIDQLTRSESHWNGSAWTKREIDNLKYRYVNNTNRLKKIEESATCVDYLYLKEAIHQDGIHAAKKKIFASSQVDGLAKLSYQAGEQIVFEEGFTIEAKEGGRFETNLTSTCPTNLATTGGFEQTSDNDYLYDKNGNLKEDPNKKMDIYYNYLNLPYKVVFENGNQIEWLYDASGKKLQKKSFKQTELLSTRDYIEGIELKDGVLEAIYHSEGRAVAKDGQFEYEYNLSDHLGNNRVLFSDTNNDGGIDVNTEILQTSDYYPFGMEMKGDFRKNERVAQQYLYNGKELDTDFGLNWYHYGARMYDPAVGRFTGVDPISDQFAWVSTYNYAENEPIANIDLWGLQRLPFGIKEKARAILNQLGFKEQPAKSRHWTPTAGDFHDSGSEVGTGLEVMTGDNKLPGAGTSDQATAKDGSTAIIDEILTAGPGISSKFAKDKVGQPLNALNRISDIKQKIEKIDSRISEPDSSSPKEEEAKDTISATDYGSYIMYKLSSKNTEANKKDNDNDE